MKATLILLGSGLLAATLAVAQDAPVTSNQDQDSATSQAQSNQTTHSYQTSNNVIRGCLSGSVGNYTITDLNGTQYSVTGTDNQLQASVGHEVELTTRQDQTNQSRAQGGQTTATTTNSVQVSNLHDIASTCRSGHSTSTPPMNDQASPTSPKGTPDAAEPPQAEPQPMAMLQQQESTPGSATPRQTTPPVTSQTPVAPGASTSSTQQNAQQGAATSSTTTTQPQEGTTPTVDQNAAPSPSATASGSSAATPSSNTQPPQANSNGQNKPLYERQATDIPWANSGDKSGTNNSNSGAKNPSEQNPPH
jgi:hypothetical protein